MILHVKKLTAFILLMLSLFIIEFSSIEKEKISSSGSYEFINNSREGLDTLTLEERAKLLSKSFDAYQQAQTIEEKEEYEQEFFDLFPSNFNTLISLYGWDKNEKEGLLLDEAAGHILSLFNNIQTVPDTIYAMKIIDIGKGGYWQPDGINYFKRGLMDRVKKSPFLYVELLKNYPKKDQEGFWFFFFDNPHPTDNVPSELEAIKEVNSEAYDTILKMLLEVKKGG